MLKWIEQAQLDENVSFPEVGGETNNWENHA